MELSKILSVCDHTLLAVNATWADIKAICDVTLDGVFAVHGVKLIKGQNGTFVSMPFDKWKNNQGDVKINDVVHPLDSATRAGFNTVGVYDRYGFDLDRLEKLSTVYLDENMTYHDLTDIFE